MSNNDLTVEVKAEPADAGLENAPPVMPPKRAAEGGNDADHADHAAQPPRNAQDAERAAAQALDAAPRAEPARPAHAPPDAEASLNARSKARGTGVHDRDGMDGADDAARS